MVKLKRVKVDKWLLFLLSILLIQCVVFKNTFIWSANHWQFDYNIGMQDHLFASSRQPQPYMELNIHPNSNAPLLDNTKKSVFIDLCATDEPSLGNVKTAYHTNAPFRQRHSASNRIVMAGNTKQPKSKVIGKTESQGTSSTSIRTDFKPNAIVNQPANNQPPLIEVFDVDGFVNVQTNTYNRPHVQPKTKKAIQHFVIQQSREESSCIKHFRHGQNEENRRLFQSLVFQRHEPPPINEMPSLDEGFERKKARQASICLEDVNQFKRRTRNRVRNQGEFFEDPDDIDFYDEEVKKRMKVAKYRYSIIESSRTISELLPKVTNRIHSGNIIAAVQPVPSIPFNSQKHRILIECLKLQFRKRKFVYLQ